ncbi:MAG: thymidylate synthase [Methanomicrobiales archaeon]|nr:thymidylate synthase [Methanomicrobiales archaeon]
MRTIRPPTLAKAHELVVKAILEKGWVLETEDREATIEAEEIALRIEHPLTMPMVSPHSRFQQKFLEKYADDLIHGTSSQFEYDYHTRLFDWGERLVTDGKDVHVDQIEYIIRKLKESPTTRRALAITWNPVVDEKLDDCPCLQLVQCVLREGSLHMKVVFRSNDMLSAAGANMYALVRLQQHIAERLSVPIGSYTHISLVPHIYYLRDMDDIVPYCEGGEAIHPLSQVCAVCGKCPRGK